MTSAALRLSVVARERASASPGLPVRLHGVAKAYGARSVLLGALAAVLAANAGLLAQLLVLRRYWNRDLQLGG